MSAASNRLSRIGQRLSDVASKVNNNPKVAKAAIAATAATASAATATAILLPSAESTFTPDASTLTGNPGVVQTVPQLPPTLPPMAERSVAPAPIVTLPPSTAVAAPEVVAPPAPVVSNGQKALDWAIAETKGKPYVFGATGPRAYDCSGLTLRAFESAGIKLPRTSREQAKVGQKIDQKDLKPGDLIFYASGGSAISHVAIYAGNGQVFHASTSSKPVGFGDVDMGSQRIVDIRRN